MGCFSSSSSWGVRWRRREKEEEEEGKGNSGDAAALILLVAMCRVEGRGVGRRRKEADCCRRREARRSRRREEEEEEKSCLLDVGAIVVCAAAAVCVYLWRGRGVGGWVVVGWMRVVGIQDGRQQSLWRIRTRCPFFLPPSPVCTRRQPYTRSTPPWLRPQGTHATLVHKPQATRPVTSKRTHSSTISHMH